MLAPAINYVLQGFDTNNTSQLYLQVVNVYVIVLSHKVIRVFLVYFVKKVIRVQNGLVVFARNR